ncbi:MAG: OmpH family outer membrane protein [Gemmatimonadaceae bacterium]|nr:OmpH family outer membrane protein [Gemmatimonadaceae bacterium]
MSFLARLGRIMLVAAPITSLAAQAPVKIAYVDSRYIVNNAPATPAAQAAYQKDLNAIQAQIQKMSDSLDALTAAFNKEQATLVGEKRDTRLKAISDRQSEFQARYQALQSQAQDREAELMQPILDQIKIALEDVRTEMGLTVIFDVSQSGAIVAADKNLNVSDRVLARLRTMPPPAIATAPEAKGAPSAAAKGAATGAPVSAPVGVRGPGAPPGPAGVKRPDSTAKSDSIKKKPDTTAGRRPPGVR